MAKGWTSGAGWLPSRVQVCVLDVSTVATRRRSQRLSGNVCSHREPKSHAHWGAQLPQLPQSYLNLSAHQLERKECCLMRLTPWSWIVPVTSLNKMPDGGGGCWGKSVHMHLCVSFVPIEKTKPTITFCVSADKSFLSLFQSPGLMRTMVNVANAWTSSNCNPLFQSPSSLEFLVFTLPLWWDSYWGIKWERPDRERKWVSRKSRIA